MSEKDEPGKNTQNSSVQENINSSLDKNTVGVPRDKVYDLIRTGVLRDLQGELLTWGKQRFWIVAAILSATAIFGAPLLVKELVRNLVEREVEKVERRMEEASNQVTSARLSAEGFIKEADTYLKTVRELQDKAKQVDTQFIALRQRLEAESGSVKATTTREVKDISDRIARLEKLVGEVAKDSQTSRKLIDAYQKEITELKAASLSQSKRFAENSKYQVNVYYNDKTSPLATNIVGKLTQLGFKTSSWDINLFRLPATIGLPARLPEISQNTITYEMGADTKAQEIVETLRSLVHFKQIRMASIGDPIGSTFFFSYGEKRITIYLVEKA